MCFQCQNNHKRNVAHFLYSWLCLCPLLCVFSPVFAVLATFFDNVQVEYLLAGTIQFGKHCEADTKAQTVRFQCQNDHKRNVDHFLCSWLCLYMFSPVVLLCKYRSTAAGSWKHRSTKCRYGIVPIGKLCDIDSKAQITKASLS